MTKGRLFSACAFFAFLLSTAFLDRIVAQDQESAPRGRRERPYGPPDGMGGPPPWMQQGRTGGQPPWMQGRPDGGPGRQGRDNRQMRDGQNETERNERTIGMLRAMDRNGNGKLEPDEIPEYRRNFVNSVVTRMGGDPSKTIDLNALAHRVSNSAGSSSPTPRSGSGSSKNTTMLADPLVPYFGEKEETQTPVLSFGQKEPTPKIAAGGGSNTTPTLSTSDQILRSAREIMNKYDKNKSGTLEKDKGEWVSSLPFNADKADKNRDGRITMAELIEVLGGKTGSSTGAAAVATRQSSAYDRLPSGVPPWFFERDKDQDGQLTMLEYANGNPWTETIADEFRFLDKNNDGVATVEEVFAVLKQVDEEKRLKEEQAKREQERLKGAGASAPAAQPEENKPDAPKPPGPATAVPAPGSPPKPGTEANAPPAGQPTGQAGEGSSNWRPGVSGAAPSEVPSSAPYSSGSSDSNQRREGTRSGSSRQYRSNRTGRH